MKDDSERVLSVVPTAPEQGLTVNEFAALRRVAPITVRRWIREEGMPVSQRRKGAKILIYPSEVEAWALEVWGHRFRCIGAPPGRTVTPELPTPPDEGTEVIA